jgi:phospholipase C
MDSRREFVKKATLLAGGAGLFSTLPASIQKALAIDPAAGSTYLDAKHVVILMQENRSFDHCYGTLRGVRGYNDPRAISLPDGDKVWVQKNEKGEAYLPFRLNIKETKSTWTGSLPHSWTNQVDARNNGLYDKWLIAKPSGHKDLAHAPLTMGFYNREDIPFYYSLADAFTVCDQNFCSSLTGTTPNRLYLWSGTVRESKNPNVHAHVRNEDVDYDAEASWTTFPERLEENNISWKIYQNELSLPTGLDDEEEPWLANFTDNPIEWFSQYNARFSKSYRNYLEKLIKEGKADPEVLERAKEDLEKYSDEHFEKLSAKAKNLHNKAFTVNTGDPHFRQLETLEYDDNGVKREMKVPKGDVLHQFRKDVADGELPSVSWIVAPENFSDHPGAPWYGAWYVSEVLDILTKDPEVWKNTILVLCYDENDGYFDHVPPFVPPDPATDNSGLVSKGIDTAVEHVTLEQDLKRKPREEARASAIGLGYRVPLVIASPWSRGGMVCSQVFDHTSILRLLETIFKVKEPNITDWRRTVCGDLSTVFRPYENEKTTLPEFVEKEPFLESVHKAQFKKDPHGYKLLTKEEINEVNRGHSSLMPKQEKGTRPACALPYELYANGKLNADKKTFEMTMASGKAIFGERSAGCPFTVYAPPLALNRNYTVAAGDRLADSWALDDFQNGEYHFTLYGPNGFFREFQGDGSDPKLNVEMQYERMAGKKLSGNVTLAVQNNGSSALRLLVQDNAYGAKEKNLGVKAFAKSNFTIDLKKSSGWYDFTVTVAGHKNYSQRFAGHVETGTLSITDPAMGGVA